MNLTVVYERETITYDQLPSCVRKGLEDEPNIYVRLILEESIKFIRVIKTATTDDDGTQEIVYSVTVRSPPSFLFKKTITKNVWNCVSIVEKQRYGFDEIEFDLDFLNVAFPRRIPPPPENLDVDANENQDDPDIIPVIPVINLDGAQDPGQPRQRSRSPRGDRREDPAGPPPPPTFCRASTSRIWTSRPTMKRNKIKYV